MDSTTMEIGARGARREGEGGSAAGHAQRGQRIGVAAGLAPTIARIALGLGLLGVGLGLAELLAPRRMLRLIGARDRSRTRALTRAFGARELVSGLGLLGRRRPAPWLWARVAGDAVDLAALATQARRSRTNIGRVAGAIAAVAGVTALDVYAAARSRGRERAAAASPVRRAITIAVTPARAYAFWRDLQNLPSFMAGLHSVYEIDARRSRWRAWLPMGRTLEWEADIIEERPNERIAWRSVGGSDVAHGGEVRFRQAPGGRGTEIAVELAYVPPAGELGRAAAWFSNQALQVRLDSDLRRLKQLLELGELAHSDASIHPGRHPARPARGPRVPAEASHEGQLLVRQAQAPRRDGARSAHPERERRDREDHVDRDLRLGSAPLQRASSRRWRRATSSATSSWARSSRSGAAVKNLKAGDRVVVPFPIACGALRHVPAASCTRCARTRTRTRGWPRSCWGHSPAGLFGYSHMLGGFAGGQAEYARVPFADVGPLKVPDGLRDEQVLFLSDIFPTGYMGAEMCDIKPGDVDRGLGRGPGRAVRDRAARACSAPSGSSRSIGSPTGCEMALAKAGATDTINYEEVDVHDALRELTGGRGPDACIDAVGMEAHGHGAQLRLRPGEAGDDARDGSSDRAARGDSLRAATAASCRSSASTAGFIDKFPMGAVMNRSSRSRPGSATSSATCDPLLARIEARRDRSQLRHHAPPAAVGSAARVRDVPGKAGQLREGRLARMTAAVRLRRRSGNSLDLPGRALDGASHG